ncbi:type II secretion system protein [Janthinobacterium sp. hw3]|uniref:Type II secretion system protein n=2 Tax=Janthinobacterium fluminis TaxID=2987524 RepID=A0ABT5K5X8_9BURK|nr:type II secretion system protein [Janthinobacterium fluminis]MDC8760400.1 type II secretion system protein [Janthinobacterium fluminis]
MVELITVMVIIGILAAVGAARFFDRQGFDADAFTAQVKALLRHGQKVAIAQNRAVFVRLDGQSVALCFDAGCASRLQPPSAQNSGSATTLSRCGNDPAWACEGAPAGVTVSGAATFRFDALGKPFAATDAAEASVSTFRTLALSVSGDGNARPVRVEQETGYVW